MSYKDVIFADGKMANMKSFSNKPKVKFFRMYYCSESLTKTIYDVDK